MAGKSRRVASRQSQLNRRKKRQQRGPSGIPNTPLEPVSVGAVPGADDSDGTVAVAAPQPVMAPEATTAPATPVPSPTRSPSRARDDQPIASAYMGPELRRILVMASTGFAVLIALKFIL